MPDDIVLIGPINMGKTPEETRDEILERVGDRSD